MNLGIVIQARSGSKRFPNKIFYKIGYKSILEHVIDRVKSVNFKKKIIIATTKKKKDLKVIKISKDNKCFYYKGDNTNVLKRLYYASKKINVAHIIRISADSPFIDPKLIEHAYKIYKRKRYDYVSNIIKPTYPKGMSCEIFSFKSLKRAFYESKSIHEREHVTPYIIKNPKLFKIKNFSSPQNIRHLSFAVDFKKDLSFLKKLFKKINKRKNLNLSCKNLIKMTSKI